MQSSMLRHQMPKERIDALLESAQVGHLATIDPDGHPYVVPLHFVHLGGRIFFHGLARGQKLENIAREPKCGFEVTGEDVGIIEREGPCQTGTAFRSVVIRGLARKVEDEELKLKVLDALVAKYSPRHVGKAYDEAALAATEVVCLSVASATGKTRP